jgi:hypothetical protein
MFEEKKIIDAVTYRESGHIEVREALLVLKDGVEISKIYHRYVIDPDKPIEDDEPEIVKTIGNAVRKMETK